MRVVVNGDEIRVEEGATVADVVRSLTLSSQGVAVALDRSVVPRSEWSKTSLHDGAHIEVLAAAAGG
jgi:sulfur carrier protein